MTILIIIPVYKGLSETQSCIESTMRSLPFNQQMIKILIIDDHSPEPALVQYLDEIKHPQITVIHNATNLGFVATVNLGMAQRGEADVILLNSDTEVQGNWVDRLYHGAYSEAHIASVTPFSNNATICSFPLMAEDNPLIFNESFLRMETVFSKMPQVLFEIPTGVGFCMYIKHAALSAIGLFDVDAFGKGYGEENDFCQRAIKQGWKNILLGNTFVYHKGQTSFQDTRDERVQNAIRILRQRYPHYESSVQQFIQDDPARQHRLHILLNYIRTSPLIKIGCIHQGTGGGVVRHINELAEFYKNQAIMLHIYPAEYEDFINITLWKGMTLSFNIKTEFDFFIDTLKKLCFSHLHYHHLMRLHPRLWCLAKDLGISYDVTLHDFYVVNGNPTQTCHGQYVGHLDPPARNQRCQIEYPLPQPFTQETWHAAILEFLQQARYVFTPSCDTAQYIQKDYPDITITPTYPPEAHELAFAPEPRRLAEPGRPLNVVIIGAISQEKGADVIQKVATIAHKTKAPIQITIMGYTHQRIKHIAITGAYKESDARALLESLKPDIIWLPAIWPETYSYTLSYALSHECPILAFDIGAFKERLQSRNESYLLPLDTSAEHIVDWFTAYHQHSPDKDKTITLPVAQTDFYQQTYLKSLVADSNAAIDFETWHIADLNMIAQNDRGFKIRVLKALLKIKRLPVVVLLVDLIPLSFQKKVKRFLSRRPLTEL